MNSGSTMMASLTMLRVPALMMYECKLLGANRGCFKYHILFAGHLSWNCKNRFLDASNYRPVTQAIIDNYKVLHAQAAKPSTDSKLIALVAAVALIMTILNWTVKFSAFIETIAAVLLLLPITKNITKTLILILPTTQ